jgi:2-oxoglutarate/2-oxoacid ferredoxin oxidoreductase subunit beta
MQTLMEHNGLVTGLIYQNAHQPSYQQLVHGYSEEPLSKADLGMTEEKFDELVAEFM